MNRRRYQLDARRREHVQDQMPHAAQPPRRVRDARPALPDRPIRVRWPRSWPGRTAASAGLGFIAALAVSIEFGRPDGRGAVDGAVMAIILCAIAAMCIAAPAAAFRLLRSRLSLARARRAPVFGGPCYRCGQPYEAHTSYRGQLLCERPPETEPEWLPAPPEYS